VQRNEIAAQQVVGVDRAGARAGRSVIVGLSARAAWFGAATQLIVRHIQGISIGYVSICDTCCGTILE